MYKDVISDPESETKDCLSMDSTLTDMLIDYFEANE